MVMDLEGEMTVVPMPTPSSNYLHESSTKLKLMGTGNNGTQNQQQPTTEEPSRVPLPVPVPAALPAAVTAVPPISAPTTTTPTPAGGGYDATASAVAAAAAAVAATIANNNNNGNSSSTTGNGNGSGGSKKPVRYRECQKNHAAGIGGHALDGCGEFMPSGEEGTIEALKCSACDCHRNFHRREAEGETPAACESCWYNKTGATATPAAGIAPASKDSLVKKRTPSLLSPLAAITPGSNTDAGATVPGAGMTGYSGSLVHHPHMNSSGIKKRFRTKFTNEQKERMYQFADRLGWRIQKHDEAEVQQFCAEVGVKRHVLKVWMHNNKNTYGKKL